MSRARINKLGLPPQREAMYIKQLQAAPPYTLELARAFQRLAFAYNEERSIEYKVAFEPAPVYLQQAYALLQIVGGEDRQQPMLDVLESVALYHKEYANA
jgi:hypothetical protein